MVGLKNLRVSLAMGQGTSPELATVFEKVLKHLAAGYSLTVNIQRSPRFYETYFSMVPGSSDPRVICSQTDQDVEHYEAFCKELAAKATWVLFKTAINAQSLYLIRQHQEAVKVECFNEGPNALLLVRDQAQGFYTGSNQHDTVQEAVSRMSTFCKGLTGRIVSYSIMRARQLWGPRCIDSVTMVYKFHLFDGVMSMWSKEWSMEHGIKVNFVQPDTANRNLLAHGLKGRQLMIAGNEWADIMHVMLLDMFGYGAQEARCTENVYLAPALQGLTEYQTVHGSADDIGGKGIVNPAATIRAAARILERHGDCTGLVDAMETVLSDLQKRKKTTKDQGGSLSTMAVVNLVLSRFKVGSADSLGLPADEITSPEDEPETTQDAFSLGKRTALLVMDFQNDFVTPEGVGAHYRGDMARMQSPTANIPLLTRHARSQGHTVAFVRFLGDRRFQTAAWRERDAALGKRPKCIEHTWGSQLFHTLAPAPGERVFDKHACFDAFLCEGFEGFLAEEGIEHLVLTGVYTDVCVDSTARTGFQKGFRITVVSDCTTTLHLPFEPYLAYMERLYGARVVGYSELIGTINSQEGEESIEEGLCQTHGKILGNSTREGQMNLEGDVSW